MRASPAHVHERVGEERPAAAQDGAQRSTSAPNPSAAASGTE